MDQTTEGMIWWWTNDSTYSTVASLNVGRFVLTIEVRMRLESILILIIIIIITITITTTICDVGGWRSLETARHPLTASSQCRWGLPHSCRTFSQTISGLMQTPRSSLVSSSVPSNTL